jgi:hypothetical protein
MLAMLRLILMTKLFNVFIELMATALFVALVGGLMLMLIVGEF